MRKIVNSTYVTLDGVVSEPHLWSLDYFDEAAGAFALDQLRASDALLMGRATYHSFAGAWPARSGDEFSDTMNKMAKYVASTTLTSPEWNNTTVLTGDLPDAVRELKQAPGADILVYGYGPVARTLVTHGLLDELRLWIHPVLRGAGEQLFGEGVTGRFGKVETRTFASGTVVLVLSEPRS
ncbi:MULTISPECIES: dihydrofolate reductase family protein [unclassified Amycolatopsis]|uniref:dihydrofolate reductase family protein n=1 Tax=unclassified Amycolatopsis TaxID=2618356 RepID=UPI002E12C22B|nr:MULTISPECIES: dihydrofolate reductase family protein [unclassified Amycolatopsis]WSK83467.1 dihydrofolate reductase family protein [Amycolatopsis sp. NBC_01286]